MILEAIPEIERGILAAEVNLEVVKILKEPGWEVEANKKELEIKLAKKKIDALNQLLGSL